MTAGDECGVVCMCLVCACFGVQSVRAFVRVVCGISRIVCVVGRFVCVLVCTHYLVCMCVSVFTSCVVHCMCFVCVCVCVNVLSVYALFISGSMPLG